MRTFYTLLTFLCITVGIHAQNVIYTNNFNDGLNEATVVGDGAIEWDNTKGFGYVYHNATEGEAIRTNYLLLDSTIFEDITAAGTYEMTIQFWVNFGTAENYFWSPMFTAYAGPPVEGENSFPMMALQTRLWMQHNLAGWCDYTNEQNVEGTNYESAAWVEDGDWHLYTMTLDTTSAKIYTDDTLRNEWTLTNTEGNTSNGLFENGSELRYICLGGNQAWTWSDPDPAFKYDDVTIYSEVLDSAQIAAILETKKSGLDTVITEEACASFTSPSGKEWTESGGFQDTIPNAAADGDSIIYVNLTILNTESEITTQSCGDYTAPSGKVFSETGIYTDTIPNAAGCDSIITIDLEVTDVLQTEVIESFCDQDDFTSPTGKIWTETGVYKDTLTSSTGCDSVITFDLTFGTSTTSNITESICGGSYISPSEKEFSETGTYTDTIPNAAGCDSVITIDLTVNTTDVAGDADCSGSIDGDEIAGDINADGSIGDGEIAGDIDGDGSIGDGEIAGDINGDGEIGDGEVEGDINGDGTIGDGEVEGDTNGNGTLDDDEGEGEVSINEVLASSIKIYPNPATDVLNINTENGNFVIENVQIRTITGITVLKENIAKHQVKLDLNGFDSGMYIVTITTDLGQFNKNIIVE